MLFPYLPSDKTIAQHNEFVTGRFMLQLNELRMFTYMLLQIKKGDKEYREIHIPCRIIGGANAKVHYSQMRDTCKTLTEKVIHVNEISEKGKRRTINIPLFAISVYEDGEGFVRARFNDQANQYLLNLTKNFTYTQFNQLMRVSSAFGYRIYWLLKQYSDFGERTFALAELKNMMMLEDKYPNFSNFRRRVLEPAQKELESTDMRFTYQAVKRGRSVHKIKFTFAGKLRKKIVKKSTSPPKKRKATISTIQDAAAPILTTHRTAYIHEWLIRFGVLPLQAEEFQLEIPESKLYSVIYRFVCDLGENENPTSYCDKLLHTLNLLLRKAATQPLSE